MTMLCGALPFWQDFLLRVLSLSLVVYKGGKECNVMLITHTICGVTRDQPCIGCCSKP